MRYNDKSAWEPKVDEAASSLPKRLQLSIDMAADTLVNCQVPEGSGDYPAVYALAVELIERLRWVKHVIERGGLAGVGRRLTWRERLTGRTR